MVIETRIGTVEHEYDQRTGARRFSLSLDVVALGIATAVSVLGLRLLRHGLPQLPVKAP